MSLTSKFFFHGTPNSIHQGDDKSIKPRKGGLLFTTDDLDYARCYTIKDENCVSVSWNDEKWHIILINEPDDLGRPGYVYQIPTSGINFQEHASAEFITTESHPITGPNAIVHGIRELIERHDVQIYIMPVGADPEIFTKALDCPSVVTMQGYLRTLGCRHLNDEWGKNTDAKNAQTSAGQTGLDPTL